jgi:hypothetical protein
VTGAARLVHDEDYLTSEEYVSGFSEREGTMKQLVELKGTSHDDRLAYGWNECSRKVQQPRHPASTSFDPYKLLSCANDLH